MANMRDKPAGITPAQTVGPFFSYALTPKDFPLDELVTDNLVTPDAQGARIRITGQVFDGDGAPVPEAFLEIWQADSAGHYVNTAPKGANSRFLGFGRAPCDATGRFTITTIRPGAVRELDGRLQAPHLTIAVFARGLLKHLPTRIYFADEPANIADPILLLVPPERRTTLIARKKKDGGDVTDYAFDIRLQGADETVFFTT